MASTRRSGASALVIVLLIAAAAAASAQELRFESVDRKINLKAPIVKVTDAIKAKNAGKAPVDAVTLCYPAALADRMALLKVTHGADKQRLAVTPLAAPPAGAPAGVACYSAALPSPLTKGATASLTAAATLTAVTSPNPASIRQGERQLVEYAADTLQLVTPYAVDAATLEVSTPTDAVVAFTPHATAARKGTKLTYGPFAKAAPWAGAIAPLRVHYAQPKPHKQVVSCVREIEVSHWGNVYVEESYIVANAGANHTGKFSRLRFQHDALGAGSSFQELRARLPAEAHSLYYKDLIGNVSSSDTLRTPAGTAVALSLRYPLMGGWKVDFVLGYSVPLAGFLYRRPKGGAKRLIMDFGVPFDDVWVETLEVRVVLPEGSHSIAWTIPFDVDDQTWDTKHTYLDTSGRPVLVLTKRNVVWAHSSAPFAVDYKFSRAALWREPALLIAAFALLFALASFLGRLELVITRDDAWKARQGRSKAAVGLNELDGVLAEEQTLLQRLASLVEATNALDDAEAALAERAAIEAELRALEPRARAALKSVDAASPADAAAAREHVERGAPLRARGSKLLTDKLELLKKSGGSGSGMDASKRIAPALKAFTDAAAEYAAQADAVLAA